MSKTIADRHVLSQLNDCGEGDYLSSFSCRALCVCVCVLGRERAARSIQHTRFPFGD